MKIDIDDLAEVVEQELEKYNQEVTDGLKKEVKNAAKEMIDELKNTSPKNSGDYAAGWAVATEYESEQDIRMRVYNRKKPQLTHLLENGHAKANGGRVEGQPHIAPAEKNAANKLEERAKVVVK